MLVNKLNKAILRVLVRALVKLSMSGAVLVPD